MASDSPWRRQWRWLWLVAFMGGLVFVVRDVDTIRDTALTPGVLHRPLTMVAVGVLLLPVAFRRMTVPFRGIIALLTIFGLWRLTSTLWSPEPLWTLYRSLEYLVMIALTAYTGASLRSVAELREWMNWVWGWTGVLLATVWIGLLVAPDQALRPVSEAPAVVREAALPFMLHGVFPAINANSVGVIGGVLALVGANRLLGGERRKGRWTILMLTGVTTMLLAQGRSALAGFACGLALILFLYKRIGIIGSLALLAVGGTVAFSLDAVLWDFLRRGQSAEFFGTFSGRMGFWEYAWNEYIRVEPWRGYGAFAGVRFLVLADLGRGTMSTLHSTWMETAVEIGIPGVLLLLSVLVAIWVALLRTAFVRSSEQVRLVSVEISAVLALVTVRSFFTTELILHSSWYFFLAVGALKFLTRTSDVRQQRAVRFSGAVQTGRSA